MTTDESRSADGQSIPHSVKSSGTKTYKKTVERVCPACDGRGKYETGLLWLECEACDGDGEVTETTVIERIDDDN